MSSQQRPEPKKADTSLWDACHGRIETDKGGWEPEKGIVHSHGYSLLKDFVGRKSFFEILFLNVIGRLPDPRLAQWLEALFICLSWPDARIWCNQVGSLAGTMAARPSAAVAAGILASDSRMYGPGVIAACIEFIDEALFFQEKKKMTAREILAIQQSRRKTAPPVIPGYKRPVPQKGKQAATVVKVFDERIIPMRQVARHLGYPPGKRLVLAHKIHTAMRPVGGAMNLAGYAAAFLRDAGCQPHEICRLLGTWVHSGVHACYAEAADRPAGTFFPLRCEDIDYQGVPPRAVPERR